jgi:hypothetical protein
MATFKTDLKAEFFVAIATSEKSPLGYKFTPANVH